MMERLEERWRRRQEGGWPGRGRLIGAGRTAGQGPPFDPAGNMLRFNQKR